MGAIKFLRNNAMISITPNRNNTNFEPTTAIWLAMQIDSIILASSKVHDPKLIPSPRIDSVEILSELPLNWDSRVKIRVVARDVQKRKLFIRKFASGLREETNNDSLIVCLDQSTDSLDSTSNPTIKLWIWNEDLLTSLIQVEVPFITIEEK
jgi:hypothetical protein